MKLLMKAKKTQTQPNPTDIRIGVGRGRTIRLPVRVCRAGLGWGSFACEDGVQRWVPQCGVAPFIGRRGTRMAMRGLGFRAVNHCSEKLVSFRVLINLRVGEIQTMQFCLLYVRDSE